MGVFESRRTSGYHAATTEVIVTGTGIPGVDPNRAGAGVLVRHGDIALQFDAGRATAERMVEAGTDLAELDAIFLTHYHSDHVIGLHDFVLSRWVEDDFDSAGALEIVAPNGATVRYCERMLDLWSDDLQVRAGHNGRSPDPNIRIVGFDTPTGLVEVWAKGELRVFAGPVRHEPVEGAVGYRIETPDSVVAISGDTVVCDEVAVLAKDADVVVYEATRFDQVRDLPAEVHFITDYHADTKLIGAQMEALGVPTLMLTHLIPPPSTPEEKRGFHDDVRRAGFTGRILVCDDLDRVVLEGKAR